MKPALMHEHIHVKAAMMNRSSESSRRARQLRNAMHSAICALALTMIAPLAMAAATVQKHFASPAEGVAALAEAVKSGDAATLRAILGPGGGKLINSGDAVADEQSRRQFAASYETASKIRLEGDARAVVLVGKDEWPLPIPLVKSADGWRFDARQGRDEILKRRIGRNELAAMEVCRAIVDAEREYGAKDQDRDGLLEYAPKLVSTPGKRDGLYWEAGNNEPPSPLGPLLGAAAKDGYTGSSAVTPLAPYHGYYYRILARQGKDASGGAYDYMVRGKMIGGFAVIAYPARYGASGIMSFIVNHDGVVYEKDLGKNTAAIAAQMTAFNPDASWNRP
jgi:Protein of unknown function (DUF2950)